MANFHGDLSKDIILASLTCNTTGITTDASAAGNSVDLVSNVANIVNAIQVVGDRTGTGTPTLTSKVQESTDGSNNWTDVTGGGFTAVTTTNNVQVVPFKPTKRYVRTTGTFSGTNPVFTVQTLILAPRRHTPDAVGGFDTTSAPGN